MRKCQRLVGGVGIIEIEVKFLFLSSILLSIPADEVGAKCSTR